MNFNEVVIKRRSIRKFKDTPVDDARLLPILEQMNLAPSAGNLQAFEVFVVRNAEHRRELAVAAFNQMFVAEAPVVLLFLANPERSSATYGKLGEDFFCVQDATIACAYAELAVAAAGLSACWVGAWDEALVHRITGAPETWRTMALLAIGEADKAPDPQSRRPLGEVVHGEFVKG